MADQRRGAGDSAAGGDDASDRLARLLMGQAGDPADDAEQQETADGASAHSMRQRPEPVPRPMGAVPLPSTQGNLGEPSAPRPPEEEALPPEPAFADVDLSAAPPVGRSATSVGVVPPVAVRRYAKPAKDPHAIRRTLTPPLLTLGVLLMGTAVACFLLTDDFVLGSLPRWVPALGGLAGLGVFAAGLLNVGMSLREGPARPHRS